MDCSGTDSTLWKRNTKGTSKEHQKLFSKLVKKLVKGMDTQNRAKLPLYLVVLIAELCSGDEENPLQNDKYTGKPAWQAVKGYLAEESNEMFASAIVNIWNGISLTQEEENAVQSTLKEQ